MGDLVAFLDDNLVAVLIGLAVLLASWLVIKYFHQRKQKSPPGLPSIPILGSLPWLPRELDNLHLILTELARKYGKIYTIYFGPKRSVFLNDNDSIHEALVKQATIFADRPNNFSSQLTNPNQKGFVLSHFDETFTHNKQISLSILRDLGLGKNVMESRILSEVSKLLEAFAKHEAKPFDPSELLRISVSNVICSILFNKRFDYEDLRFCNAVNTLHKTFKQYGEIFLVNLFPILRYLPRVRRKIDGLVHSYGRVTEFIREELLEHSRTGEADDHKKDFIAAYKHKMADKLDDETMQYIVFDFFAAGTDTTATGLHWALIYMANNLDIQSRVHQEIDDVIGEGRQPTMSDRLTLSLTEAVLLETFRKSSFGPLALPHELTTDTELKGFFLEKGTRVYINIWAVHHDPDIWPDPDHFDPGRFLDNNGKVWGRQRIISFGLGRRSCLGEALARQELFLHFTSILQRFHVLPPPEQDRIPEEGLLGIVLSPLSHTLVMKLR